MSLLKSFAATIACILAALLLIFGIAALVDVIPWLGFTLVAIVLAICVFVLYNVFRALKN